MHFSSLWGVLGIYVWMFVESNDIKIAVLTSSITLFILLYKIQIIYKQNEQMEPFYSQKGIIADGHKN